MINATIGGKDMLIYREIMKIIPDDEMLSNSSIYS